MTSIKTASLSPAAGFQSCLRRRASHESISVNFNNGLLRRDSHLRLFPGKWSFRNHGYKLRTKATISWPGRTHNQEHPELVSSTLTEIEHGAPVVLAYDNIKEQLSPWEQLHESGERTSGHGLDSSIQRKTKIVCTIGPSTNTREMIWKLAEAGMNVARLNMSHGDHASHKKVIDLVKEYNSQVVDNVIALMLDTKGPEVRSGDLPYPIKLAKGQEFNFTIERGVGTEMSVSVNYDDFINDVEKGDILLVDGGMMSFLVKEKTKNSVLCEVIDGGELKSRRHLNVRGKSATLPSITERDWEDIKFGVENGVDFYAVSFVKDAQVVYELKSYLEGCQADIRVIVKIESADSVRNLNSILEASDGAMVARGDLGAELPVEEVPLLQDEIIRICRGLGKPVIVATNMLESMINHPRPTRAEVADISVAVREGADAIMLSGETANGKYPLKAVRVMDTVAIHTKATITDEQPPLKLLKRIKNRMSEIFAFHSTTMSNVLGAPILVFTRTGNMASLLSHYRPVNTVFAFTTDKKVQQRLAMYHGVQPIYLSFSDDAEKTFFEAISLLQKQGKLKAGQDVIIVQSGKQPIWRSNSSHHIQVRKVQA
ncbi:hypothetical protein O6H91_13G088400 [Diphasiastrum complanatum]|uniref:Uncharacterized protein n=4 Tax=Diphasiastrum complanatum TaxID=34168 RepID=A0ACC2BWY9_DIPCM|nr:hypothetical protein O6H91_13G088400 [Diphasiastrum complanatum]KAJ7534294.1 hypothetical protein O6H91_13G088400 [Diphasiastrum complanatum]KAJ7534295.1 hypothetical protein O6H91_13G088400 [Diphasiastrum complanatum]KAJ7534296.1 hypothetical protein O6H91_13G088400 [Diphasiastrum complanatum]